MEITILKDKLKEGLYIVERAAGKNLNLPILQNVLLQTSKNFLLLIATDLEIAVKYWILAKIKKEGQTVVPMKLLSNFISFFTPETLTLEAEGNSLIAKGPGQDIKILGQNPEDFPIIPKVETKDFFEIESSILREALAQTIDFCSLTNIRPELAGSYFSWQKNVLKIASTDSFRLAEKTIRLEKALKTPDGFSFILPQKAGREVMAIAQNYNGKVRIYPSSNQIMFEFLMAEISHPQCQLISRLIEGEYPNYREIIPKGFQSRARLEKRELFGVLKAASLFAGRANEVHISLNPVRKEIEISTQSADIGAYRGVIKGLVEGEGEEIIFNHKFLLEGLENISTQELFLEFNGKLGPTLMRPIDDESYFYVVMPIRTE